MPSYPIPTSHPACFQMQPSPSAPNCSHWEIRPPNSHILPHFTCPPAQSFVPVLPGADRHEPFSSSRSCEVQEFEREEVGLPCPARARTEHAPKSFCRYIPAPPRPAPPHAPRPDPHILFRMVSPPGRSPLVVFNGEGESLRTQIDAPPPPGCSEGNLVPGGSFPARTGWSAAFQALPTGPQHLDPLPLVQSGGSEPVLSPAAPGCAWHLPSTQCNARLQPPCSLRAGTARAASLSLPGAGDRNDPLRSPPGQPRSTLPSYWATATAEAAPLRRRLYSSLPHRRCGAAPPLAGAGQGAGK